MKFFLYICIVVTLIDVFLLVYAWTLPLFPKKWRDKVNSDPQSLDPSTNNDSITGIVIIIITAIACFLWGTFFYWLLLV